MRLAAEKGRKVKKNLKIGICGEHGGEPKSVEFCHSIGTDYVELFTVQGPDSKVCNSTGCAQG